MSETEIVLNTFGLKLKVIFVISRHTSPRTETALTCLEGTLMPFPRENLIDVD
jgi:hypothetical protein